MSTKQKILKIAASEFSRNGYRSTTIRKICKTASVNIASINYHFGDKQNLYREVVEYLISRDKSFGKIPLYSYQNDIEWENGLYEYTLDLIQKITNDSREKACLHKIIFREILDPSDLFEEFYNEYFISKVEELKRIISYKINPETDKEFFDIITFSVISQCIFYEQNKTLVSQYYSCKKFIDKKISSIKIAQAITFQTRTTIEAIKG